MECWSKGAVDLPIRIESNKLLQETKSCLIPIITPLLQHSAPPSHSPRLPFHLDMVFGSVSFA